MLQTGPGEGGGKVLFFKPLDIPAPKAVQMTEIPMGFFLILLPRRDTITPYQTPYASVPAFPANTRSPTCRFLALLIPMVNSVSPS